MSESPRIRPTTIAIIVSFVAGIAMTGAGFYEISIYNTQPPRPWGIVVFIVGLVLLTGGIVGLAGAGLSNSIRPGGRRGPHI